MPIHWTKRDGSPSPERTFVLDQMERYKVHPDDIVELFHKKFGMVTTAKCIRIIASENGLTIRDLGLITKADKAKKAILKQSPKERIKEDVEEHKLQEQLRDVSSKYRILVKEKSIGDRMIQVLKDEVKVLPIVKRAWQPSTEKVSQETAVLLLSDTHIGETVNKEEVYNFGEYNFDIFTKRLKFLANSIKSITTTKLKGYRIDKLVIYCLGDMVSGRIHQEIMERGEEIIFQVLQGSFVTAQFILEMAQMFNEVEVVGVVGNHGRLTKKPPHKRKYVNWDYLFYQFLGTFLVSNDRIKCKFPKSFFTVHKIYDWSFVLLHGDNIRSWLSIPWYGLERMMWRMGDLLQGQGVKPHYRIVGHFHNSGELDKVPGELIINGSMIGGTEYSLGKLFSFDRPTQLFMGCHAEIGVTWRYPLRLDLPGVVDVEPYSYRSELDAGKYLKELLRKMGD